MPAAPLWLLATVAPLPAPPLWERALLERPLPLIVVLLVAAAVAGVLLQRRGRAWLGLALGAALVAGAVGVWALSASVTTDREIVQQLTRELVDAVAGVDVGAVDLALTDDARLYLFLAPDGLAKPEILRRIQNDLGGRFQIKEHDVLETHASLDAPGRARTLIKVRVIPEAWGFPDTSWWRLDWRRDGAEWRVAKIEALSISSVDNRDPG